MDPKIFFLCCSLNLMEKNLIIKPRRFTNANGRIVISPLTLEYENEMIALCSNPQVMALYEGGVPWTTEKTQNCVRRWVKRSQIKVLPWWVICAKNQTFLGSIGTALLESAQGPYIEICCLLHTKFWGQRVMSEAMWYLACSLYAEANSWGFSVNTPIVFQSHPNNNASIDLGQIFGASKLGESHNIHDKPRIFWTLFWNDFIKNKSSIRDRIKEIEDKVQTIDSSPVANKRSLPHSAEVHGSDLLFIMKCPSQVSTSTTSKLQIAIKLVSALSVDLSSLVLYIRLYKDDRSILKLNINGRMESEEMKIMVAKRAIVEGETITVCTNLRLSGSIENRGSSCFACCELLSGATLVARKDSPNINISKKKRGGSGLEESVRLQKRRVPHPILPHPQYTNTVAVTQTPIQQSYQQIEEFSSRNPLGLTNSLTQNMVPSLPLVQARSLVLENKNVLSPHVDPFYITPSSNENYKKFFDSSFDGLATDQETLLYFSQSELGISSVIDSAFDLFSGDERDFDPTIISNNEKVQFQAPSQIPVHIPDTSIVTYDEKTTLDELIQNEYETNGFFSDTVDEDIFM